MFTMRRNWFTMHRNNIYFLKLFGPAWLVMMADMDASSTIGAAETGAIFKYGLIWFLLLLVIPLYFIQEVSGRIGAVTRKGLGEVIRENYSRKTAILLSFPMALTDVITYIIEYLGVAIGLEMMGVPVYITVPIVYIIHILIVTKRKYIKAEKILLLISSLLIIGFGATLAVRGIKDYSPIYFVPSPDFIYILAVNVGAVIMPFMLFFQASATAEKMRWIPKTSENFLNRAIKHVKVETLIGAIVTELLMAIVEMATAGIDPSANFASASDLSSALRYIAGSYSPYLFGIGLIGAGFLALVIISLGSAWGIVEALGIPREKSYIVYILESLPAVIVTLIIPSYLLINVVLNLLVAFIFVLIGPAIVMGMIARNKKIMGEFRSSCLQNVEYWGSLIFIVIFGILAIL